MAVRSSALKVSKKLIRIWPKATVLINFDCVIILSYVFLTLKAYIL